MNDSTTDLPLNEAERGPEMRGEAYITVLQRLHVKLKPKTYLEIGSRSGNSLALASCPSIAIDPGFNLTPAFMGQKTVCSLYRMGSDEFFGNFDPKQILRAPIDLAFLDGLHLAEFLLRDFLNTEKSCKRNSIIAIHDCIPFETSIARRREGDRETARKSKYKDWWTGDVWKVIVALRKHRPSLRIHCVDAHPTGLVLITNLQPDATDLAAHYFDILGEFRNMKLEDYGVAKYIESLDVMPTRSLLEFEDISQFFWL